MLGRLETLILDALRPIGRAWWVPPFARLELTAKLSLLFRDPELTTDEVIQLLKLIAVFEEEPRYEGVGETVIEMLRSCPSAVARIEAMRGRSSVSEEEKNQLARFEGREQEKRAPRLEERPISGVRLQDLKPPIDPAEMRARASSRKVRPGG